MLAGALVLWLKRRNGSGTAGSNGGYGGVTYQQNVMLLSEVRELSERMTHRYESLSERIDDYHNEARSYYRAGENAAEERQDAILACMKSHELLSVGRYGDLKLHVVTTVGDAMRKSA
jgi:hypothetical protein